MITLIVGILIGLVLGLTGAGGSVFAVPLLMLLLALTPQEAMGLSLGAVAISAFIGSLSRLKSNDIHWVSAAVYAAIGSAVAPLGNWLNRQSDDQMLMLAFSALVLIIAVRMWRQAQTSPQTTTLVRANIQSPKEAPQAVCQLDTAQQLSVGLPCVLSISVGAILTGFLSGLLGVGGGFLIVPTLLMLTGINMQKAVATSLVIITAISTSGFIAYLSAGNVINTTLLTWLALGGVTGMGLGMLLSRHISGPNLQKTFAVLMIIMAAASLLQQLK